MDEFYPDVLERLGKTPRELGALHIHVEPVVCAPTGAALAVVWLQAAFEPHDRGSLEVLAPDGNVIASKMRAPVIGKGAVVKWSLPLAGVAPAGGDLLFKLACSHPEDAERVRPPWKLFDTIEQPTLSDMETKYADEPVSGGSMLGIGFALGFGNAGRAFARALDATGSGSTAVGGSLAAAMKTQRHAAMALPPGFLAPVVPGDAPAIVIEQNEVVWAPGRELPAPVGVPAPVLASAAQAPVAARRRCQECGYVENEAGVDDRFCPACGNRWD